MVEFTREQQAMKETVRKIPVEKIAPRAAEIDEKEEYPKDLEDILREQGVLKFLIPEQYGGLGRDIKTFDRIRPIIAAQALGIAEGAYEIALEYSKTRFAFGQPISQFQGIQFKFADMVTSIEAARGLVYKAAQLIDNGEEDVAIYSSMAKYYASEVAMRVTTEAVQILGGYGYMREYSVERFMRDAKCTQIIEGTSEIQKMIIARRILAF